MKNILIILLILSSYFVSAQIKENDYEIYSAILNNRLEEFYSYKLDSVKSIVVIKQYKENFIQDLDIIYAVVNDSIAKFSDDILYSATYKDTAFIRRFKKEPEIKHAILGLLDNPGVQPEIKPEQLQVNKAIAISAMSSGAFNSYLNEVKIMLRPGTK